MRGKHEGQEQKPLSIVFTMVHVKITITDSSLAAVPTSFNSASIDGVDVGEL